MSGGVALPDNRWDLLDGVEPDEAPFVSVVVAYYRQPEQLARTLAALRAQDHPADRLEIIVADDGSPEPPVVADDIHLVRQPDDGFRLAAVRNLGASRARGDVLVFLDADTVPEPGYIRRLVRLPALAPDCVSVGRRRHADFAGVAVDAHPASATELPEPAWLADAYRASRNLLDADDRSYRYAIGAVLACSRRLFDDVGGFDESFTAYGGEDWEWVYRAWVRGAVLAHVPDAVAWHDGPDAGERDQPLAVRNAETLRLVDLIPVPGSRGRGLRSWHTDVLVVDEMTDATPGQRFVAIDSVLAVLPAAEAESASGTVRDRVRVRVEVRHPLRVVGDGLAAALERAAAGGIGRLVLEVGGVEAIRIVSLRAEARAARWGRDDLFPVVREEAEGIELLHEDVRVEAYVGGWGI